MLIRSKWAVNFLLNWVSSIEISKILKTQNSDKNLEREEARKKNSRIPLEVIIRIIINLQEKNAGTKSIAREYECSDSNVHKIKNNIMYYSSLQKQSETNKLSIRDKNELN